MWWPPSHFLFRFSNFISACTCKHAGFVSLYVQVPALVLLFYSPFFFVISSSGQCFGLFQAFVRSYTCSWSFSNGNYPWVQACMQVWLPSMELTHLPSSPGSTKRLAISFDEGLDRAKIPGERQNQEEERRPPHVEILKYSLKI